MKNFDSKKPRKVAPLPKLSNKCVDIGSKTFNLRKEDETMRIGAAFRIISVLTLIAILLAVVSCKMKETSPELERKLCDAAYSLDLKTTDELIKRGVNVNTTVYKSNNPLTLAILGAAQSKVGSDTDINDKKALRLLMMRTLIDAGADVNAKASGNRSALAFARVVDDDKDVEEMLLKAGANPDTKEDEGRAASAPKVAMAAVAKLSYALEVEEAAKKDLDKAKQKVINGEK